MSERLTFSDTGAIRGNNFTAKLGGKRVALIARARRDSTQFYWYSMHPTIRMNTSATPATLDEVKQQIRDTFKP